MAFTAITVLMLVSAPSDVPDDDLATVKRTTSQWNWNMGRASGVTVSPVSWSEHAVAEFGDRPQEVLNGQLVDEADMGLALFADRLGTPTGTDDSGTLEEIRHMVEAGKHVSVLVNQGARSLSGADAVAEKGRLETALEELRGRAIVLPYYDQAGLAAAVNNMLSMAAGKASERATGTAQFEAVRPDAIGVWPHLSREPYQETDSKGRLKSRNRKFIEVRNETGRPVLDVSVEVDAEMQHYVHGRDRVIDRMAPDGSFRLPILQTMSNPDVFQVRVKWHFEGEDERQTMATLS